jgi:hypothetical protein
VTRPLGFSAQPNDGYSSGIADQLGQPISIRWHPGRLLRVAADVHSLPGR